MKKFQRDVLSDLAQNSGLGQLKALVERKCRVYKKRNRGGIRAPWGIPSHPESRRGLEVNVRHVNDEISTELMSLVRLTTPVNARGGHSSYHGQPEYEIIVPKAIPGD